MSKFSLEGPDLTYLIPVLQEIVAINPDIKIIATPWSPPKWMKTSNSYIGGELKEYDIYAKYFIKYFEAMKEQGINIWAITPQNEPHHPHNEPSMYMTKEQQVDFINRYLGPAIANSEFKHVKIMHGIIIVIIRNILFMCVITAVMWMDRLSICTVEISPRCHKLISNRKAGVFYRAIYRYQYAFS